MSGPRSDRSIVETDVVVVGAGLAGLSCAVRLARSGLGVRILEGTEAVGGRVQTDHLRGFLLDRGFQVYLTAYPRAGELLDLESLDLHPFVSGAIVRLDDGFHRVADPFREPAALPATVTAPIGSLGDKLRIVRLRARLAGPSPEAVPRAGDRRTIDLLREEGFSERIVTRFLGPFFGGVFLDPELETSSRMFEFVFRMFSRGRAVLPAAGMGAIPRQLAGRLPTGTVRLNSRVAYLDGTSAVLADGTPVRGQALVVATDGLMAERLLTGYRSPRYRGTTCLYFAADSPPIEEPVLVLNGTGTGQVNHLCVPSQVAPGYAPSGRALISVTLLGTAGPEDGEREIAVREELVAWFGDGVRDWEHLRTYRIPEALPEQAPGHEMPSPRVPGPTGVYLAGDHCQSASIEGAIGSGLDAADAVLEDLGLTD